MIGHYPWHYVERAPHSLAAPHYEHEPLYSAPPARTEAQRILFPTHLRKMWSGGEVQAWLDEQLGVTAPAPSAKGSLERYRQWQATQFAHAPQPAECTCPSGNGSLRPCQVHSEGDVALPPLPAGLGGFPTGGPWNATQMRAYARVSGLADRQQRAAIAAQQSQEA